MSNVLDLYDQTFFIGERATGTTNMLQCIWVYDRGVDIDGLRRFLRHLQQGRLSRRIEPSPLPFGRHRWVSADGQSGLQLEGLEPGSVVTAGLQAGALELRGDVVSRALELG